eukprot:TRINITY_DN17142_c0_g1_i1.p3 TRINITY_DN17142_c0_g1~~TRINITY_DN17142_c0_g1_i1.p3  ORF type:complete len:147 (+),score=27.63 TRINITY_DN17142_c0_g1_i1:78-518(+)
MEAPVRPDGSPAGSSSTARLPCSSGIAVELVSEAASSSWFASPAERRRHLVLPTGLTVGQARHCFGQPLTGAARAVNPDGAQQVDDLTPLDALVDVERCRVELSFAPPENLPPPLLARFAHAAWTPVPRTWRMLREVWASYNELEG